MTGLARYQAVWEKYFVPLNTINLGIGDDRVENVLWRAATIVRTKYNSSVRD